MVTFKYRGKIVQTEEISFIKNLISDNPEASRWALSKKLCLEWGWIQPNGALQDMVCRGFMLELDRAGHIKLPSKKSYPPNPFVDRKEPAIIEVDKTPIHSRLSDLYPFEIQQVRYSPAEKLFNSLLFQHHYLGYCHPVGEQLKYLVCSKGRPIACFSWSSAVRHLGSRDKHIGWSMPVRQKNIRFIAYNSRFLILPWVRSACLASYLLGQIRKRLPVDWQNVYQHPIYLLETFVDTERFSGTCYKAANWIYLGLTTGRGKNDHTHKVNRSIKAVYCYPLSKHYKELLCHV